MNEQRILVIDDEPAMGENIRRLVRLPSVTVEAICDPREGIAAVHADPPDLVLLDIRMPGISGEDVFRRLHDAHPELPIVFLTAFGSIEGAVLAMKSGAFDYLQKPFRREDLLLVVKRALAHRAMGREVEQLRQQVSELGGTGLPHTKNPAMQALLNKASQAAATDATVLIQGESGSGKEVLAREIHRQSRRARGPLVTVDCTALVPSLVESELFGHEKGAFTGALGQRIGLIESARGGTLFLDEIGDLPLELQTRLFRFVEDRQIRRVGGVELLQIDCRLVCATNQDLHEKIKAGQFREELYFRLAIVTLEVPPLRERPEDIPDLARHFLARFNSLYGKAVSATDGFYAALASLPWPGNVRELKNTIERLVALLQTGSLTEEHLTSPPASLLRREELQAALLNLDWKEARRRYLEGFASAYAENLLARSGGNVSEAARQAGVDRKTFYGMLRRERDAQGEE